MAIRTILDYSHPVLRRKAKPVETVSPEIRRMIRDMHETMGAAPGVGLAAPQIGEEVQVIVYNTGETKGGLINPVIQESEGEQTDVEGCLSIPGLQGEVSRAMNVVVTGLNERGKTVRIKAEGYLARVLQHEIDHLNGILFIDRAKPETLHRIEVRKPADRLERAGGRR